MVFKGLVVFKGMVNDCTMLLTLSDCNHVKK